MRLVPALIALILFACSGSSYRYAPDKDHPESVVDVAGGELRVSSLGVVDVRPAAGAPWARSLHLRVLASNESKSQAWVLRPENLTVLLRGDKRLTPGFVNVANAPNELRVESGERRGFELYYPLPERVHTAGDLSDFTFEWEITAGGAPLRGASEFQRIAAPEIRVVSPNDPYYPYGPYAPYGPYGAGYWGPEIVRPVLPSRRYYSR